MRDGWQTVVFMCSGDFRAMVPCRFGSQNKTIQITNEVRHDRKIGPIENELTESFSRGFLSAFRLSLLLDRRREAHS